MVCRTPQRRQRSSCRLWWRCCRRCSKVCIFFKNHSSQLINNPDLARQRRTSMDPSGKLIYTCNHDILPIHIIHRRQPSLNQRNRLHRNICHILTSLTQRPIRYSSRRQRIHHPHFSNLTKQRFWTWCLIRLRTWLEYIYCCFWEYTRIFGNDLKMGWKVREVGRWRVCMAGYYLGPEILGTGFVMFWDWELWRDCQTDWCWSKECGSFFSSFLLVQFDSIFFLSRFSGLVLVR